MASETQSKEAVAVTIANWLGVRSRSRFCASIVIVFAACALIDYTRGVEDNIGSLADEEREREREEGGAV